MEPFDLVIIGGGPAGMACAVGAAEAGMKKIALLERQSSLGGILNQCIHVGFGLHKFRQELTGTEYAHAYRNMLEQYPVSVFTSTFVHTLTKDNQVRFMSREGEKEIHGKTIVVATGCRERTREMLTVPGTRPAGVYTAGLAQEMVNIHGVVPGKEVVIVGSGDIGLIMARRMTLEGSRVHAVLEIQDALCGLVRNRIQCLDDYGIPLLVNHRLLEIRGKDRVSGVVYENMNTGISTNLACDTVLFSVGLIPEQDLLIDAGLTTGKSLFLAGNADHVYDLADNVTKDAEALGRKIAHG